MNNKIGLKNSVSKIVVFLIIFLIMSGGFTATVGTNLSDESSTIDDQNPSNKSNDVKKPNNLIGLGKIIDSENHKGPKNSLEKIQAALDKKEIDWETASLLEAQAILHQNELPATYKSDDGSLPLKSGTPYILKVISNWENLSASARGELGSYLMRPSYTSEDYTDSNSDGVWDPGEPFTDSNGNGIWDGGEQTYNSLSGHFRVHYTLVGIDDDGDSAIDEDHIDGVDNDGDGNVDEDPNDKVPLNDDDGDGIPNYVENFANYFDISWAIEIDDPNYNFNAPPSDGTLGGGNNLYDVYIFNLGYYGVTVSESGLLTTSSSSINVNNNYDWAPINDDPEGDTIGAMKVTAAHEFFHAIQFGYDQWEDSWWMEVSSTWMEDEVFDQVNDNYNYLDRWFNNPDVSLTTFDGGHEYGTFILMKFLSENYGGSSLINDIWVQCANEPFPHGVGGVDGITAIDNVLSAQTPSTDFNTVFKKFIVANYVNSLNNDDGDEDNDAYEEGEYYPDVPSYIVSYDGSEMIIDEDNVNDGSTDADVNNWAADYISVNIAPTALTSLKILFDGDSLSNLMVQVIKIQSGAPVGTPEEISLDWFSNGNLIIDNPSSYERIIIIVAKTTDKIPFFPSGDYKVVLTSIGFPSEGFYFIHLTDLHIGQPWNFGVEEERLKSSIQKINGLSPQPAFVIITGDLVDSLTTKDSPFDLTYQNNMERLNNILTDPTYGLSVPYYLAVGNHDYRLYKRISDTNPLHNLPWSIYYSQSNMENHVDTYLDVDPSFSPKKDCYSFDYGNNHFIVLNSGHDAISLIGNPLLPEGNGLTDAQISWLDNNLDNLDGVNNDIDTSGKNKFIFMHHPAVNSMPILPIITDGTISQNRNEFIEIVKDFSVAMVITGHTHDNKVLDETGEDYPGVNWNIDNGPMFVQTLKLMDYGYRVIAVTDSNIQTTTGLFSDTTRATLESLATLHARDQSNNHVGYNSIDNSIDVNIPYAIFTPGAEVSPEVISLQYGSNYNFSIEGTSTGLVDLTIEHFVGLDHKKVLHPDIPVSSGSKAYVNVILPNPDYTIYIDGDGDGNYEESRSPSEIIGVPISVPIPHPPEANTCTDQITAFEGDTVHLDGTCSQAFDGEIISYEWTFNNHVLYGPQPTFIWFDNIVVTVTLTITYLITYYSVDDDGNLVANTEIGTSSTSLTVTILNVPPTASIDRAYMYVDFTLRGAGEKWHNVFWDLYETDWASDGGPLIDSNLIAHLEIERSPGDPDKQSDTVYDVYIDMEKIYYFVATYYPFEDDKPINGQLQGSNPIWIDLTFEDGSTERIHHNFNVEQSMKKDSDHWVHVEPWYIDLSPWFVEHEITFEVSSEDPGTDDETFTMDWDDATSLYIEFYPYRSSGATDPYPSPYDSHEGSYPVEIHDTYYHTYMFEDDFFPELFVMDDDSGTNNFRMNIDAIHTEHIYPVK